MGAILASLIVTVLELVGGAPVQGWGETRVAESMLRASPRLAVLAARKTLASPFIGWWHSPSGAAMQVVWQMEP